MNSESKDSVNTKFSTGCFGLVFSLDFFFFLQQLRNYNCSYKQVVGAATFVGLSDKFVVTPDKLNLDLD